MANTCLGCGIKMPMEDGHDQCVHCLGLDHARMACQDPSFCMNCFILPARVREARARVFPVKRPAAITEQLHKSKQPRMVVSDDPVAQSPHPSVMSVRLRPMPPPVAAVSTPPTVQLPASSWQGQEGLHLASPMSDGSDEGDIDILTVNTEDGGLFPVQEGVESKQVEGEQEQEVTSPLYHQLLTRAAEALGIDMPAEQGQRASRFDDVDTTQSRPFTIPLLPDVEDLVLKQFLKPAPYGG